MAFTLLLVVTGFWGSSQSQEKTEGDSIPWEFRKQAFIYSKAIAFNDPQVARMALYNLLSENPGNPSIYDSLAWLYLQYNQFVSAALVAKQSLELNNDNLFATEIVATSFDNLGVKDKAIPYYETLYLADNDLTTLYKIAFLQFEVDRFKEAVTSADIIIQNPEAATITFTFPTEDGVGQEILLKVCAHRIKAMIKEEEGNKEEAMQLYLETLQMHPGFQVVQKQLRELTKKEE